MPSHIPYLTALQFSDSDTICSFKINNREYKCIKYELLLEILSYALCARSANARNVEVFNLKAIMNKVNLNKMLRLSLIRAVLLFSVVV